jgi:hypothetical protein
MWSTFYGNPVYEFRAAFVESLVNTYCGSAASPPSHGHLHHVARPDLGHDCALIAVIVLLAR